jgi:hypothetical protein
MASTVRILFYVLSVDFVSLCAVVGSLLLFFFQFTTQTRLLRDRRRQDGSSGATIHPRLCVSFTFEASTASPSPTPLRLCTSARPMARPAQPEFSVVAITDMAVHARLFCLACQTDSHETLDTLRAAYPLRSKNANSVASEIRAQMHTLPPVPIQYGKSASAQKSQRAASMFSACCSILTSHPQPKSRTVGR